jgi:hypothetical protein
MARDLMSNQRDGETSFEKRGAATAEQRRKQLNSIDLTNMELLMKHSINLAEKHQLMKRKLIAAIVAGLALSAGAGFAEPSFAEPTLDFDQGSWRQSDIVVQSYGEAQSAKQYDASPIFNVNP